MGVELHQRSHSRRNNKLQGVARKLAATALLIAFAALSAPADADDDAFVAEGAIVSGGVGAASLVAASGPVRSVKVGLNKSLVIDLPRDARDILVSNPIIADAVIRTPRRIYITGVAVGQSNVIIFDRAGQQIVILEMEVERDPSTLSIMLDRLVPESAINVEIVSDNIILSGTVRNAGDARRAEDIATAFANGGAFGGTVGSGGTVLTSSVVNMLTITGEDQVHLKITIVEMQRSALKQLGVNLSGEITAGAFSLGFNSEPASFTDPPSSLDLGFASGGFSIDATLRALEQTGMLKTLAEPTLTAISGESASFLAGGEFPVPVPGDVAGVEFKPFGVALAFTPVVLSEGRISLRVKTEVSALSSEGAITIGGTSVPSLTVRRAESTLELPSGGSMVLGGLIQDNVRQTIGAVPALGRLPILGTLFRSRDFQRSETELVVIATPYLVGPTTRSALATPDQGFQPASDAQSIFLGNVNRVYGGPGDNPAAYAPSKFEGSFGFIFE